jgi:hypothetical protein
MSTLSAQDICTRARAIAKCPGYASQSGQWLNAILEDLAQTYNFDVIKGTYNFSFNSGGYTGVGPYPLPTNWYRGIDDDIFYVIDGVPYSMINIELDEYDRLVQNAGLASYPEFYATDMSQSPPVMYVWPPASGAYPVTARYFKQSTTITTPETSSDIPWFPNTLYLITRLAGELMKETDDLRWERYIGSEEPKLDTEGSAASILRKYLRMKDDRGGKVYRVKLDRRLFRRNFDRLPNTKTIGW